MIPALPGGGLPNTLLDAGTAADQLQVFAPAEDCDLPNKARVPGYVPDRKEHLAADLDASRYLRKIQPRVESAIEENRTQSCPDRRATPRSHHRRAWPGRDVTLVSAYGVRARAHEDLSWTPVGRPLRQARPAIQAPLARHWDDIEPKLLQTAQILPRHHRGLGHGVRGAQLDDISAAFGDEVNLIGIPTDGTARIDPDTFLPLVGDTAFEDLQASGGGASTALNIAYHLTLLTTALDHPDVLLPSLLIIDSPRKAIGTVDRDRELGRRIYTRLATLAEAYKDRIQLIVADNDIPAELVTTRNTIVLTSERSAVPGVTNTGVGEGQRVEDL
ncbi:hypothetical protein [Nonomuraea sp. NPDC049784]|uniref:hypothetical protein n=1 Tax=Nonomuraea sp. NPDC049784 TaxID=3154361 RepID=UPI0033DF7DBB